MSWVFCDCIVRWPEAVVDVDVAVDDVVVSSSLAVVTVEMLVN